MAFSRIGIAALGGCNEFGFDVVLAPDGAAANNRFSV
jgi:hypothetical protein